MEIRTIIRLTTNGICTLAFVGLSAVFATPMQASVQA
jgi:hypothetical protein